MHFIAQLIFACAVLYFSMLWILRKLKLRYYDTRYVFITGCDTGFGSMLTKRLDKLGFHVFAGCFTEAGVKSIKQICSKNVIALEIDVTKETSIQNAKSLVEKKLPQNKGLWALVNNAGVAGVVAPTEWLTRRDFEQVINVNLFGVIYVTQAFLPLVRKESGRIVNMASMCGRVALATSAYCAAKFGVEGFSDALRHDLYTTGVSVHIIEPGYFDTGIVSEGTISAGLNDRFEQATDEVKQYYGTAYRDAMKETFSTLLCKFVSPRVEHVVDAYEHAISARFPKIRYLVGWDANILARLLWNLPERVADFVMALAYPKPCRNR